MDRIPSPLSLRILRRAQAEVGVSEDRGDNDGIPSLRYMGGRREPWCAHFISWLFREEGVALPGDITPGPNTANPLAGVSFMEKKFRERDWIIDPMAVCPGDVVFFKTRGGSDVGPGRHVGLVESVATAGKVPHIQTIEGNLGNRVGRMVYSVNNSRISSIGRVPDVGAKTETEAGNSSL